MPVLTAGHARAGDTWPVYVLGGILREAKRHRHFRGKDYEIKQKEEH